MIVLSSLENFKAMKLLFCCISKHYLTEASTNMHFPHQEITVWRCIPPFDLWTMTQRSTSSRPVLGVSGQKSLDKSANPLPKWRWVDNLFHFKQILKANKVTETLEVVF